MKAFFSLRGDSRRQQRVQREPDVTAAGYGYDSRDDIYYPTKAASSAAASGAADDTQQASKPWRFKRQSSSPANWTDGHIGAGAGAGAGAGTDTRPSHASIPMHGPASSSSASSSNAADIGSTPVPSSVRSRQSNGSFGGLTQRRGSSHNGSANGIGALLGGFNSRSSLGKDDAATIGSRRTSRHNALAALFQKGGGGDNDRSASNRPPLAKSSSTTSALNNRVASSHDSSSTNPHHNGGRSARLGRQGSVTSYTSSRASLRSDASHHGGSSGGNGRGMGLAPVKNLFSSAQRSPIRDSPPPSSYYDPTTTTRTKRRGITPPLESRTSGGLREAADVHPEVFIVSKDSDFSGGARGDSRPDAATPRMGKDASPVPANRQELENAPPPPPKDATAARTAAEANAPLQQQHFDPAHAHSSLVQESLANSKRSSTMSTATIQPSKKTQDDGSAADGLRISESQKTVGVVPRSPSIGGPDSTSKPSLRKRISGTLRPRKSLNLLSIGGNDRDRQSTASAADGGKMQDDFVMVDAEDAEARSNTRPPPRTATSATSLQTTSLAAPTSASRTSSVHSAKTDQTGREERPSRRRDHILASSPPSAAHNRLRSLGGAASTPPADDSRDLAVQLNELAISHADGLLTDEEYRMLRQGLFEQQMSSGASGPGDSPSHGLDGGAPISPPMARLIRRGSQKSYFSEHDPLPTQTNDGHLALFPAAARGKSRSNTVSTAHTVASSSSSSVGTRSLHPSAPALAHAGSRSIRSGSSSVHSAAHRSETQQRQEASSSSSAFSARRLRLTSSASGKSQKRAQDLEQEIRRRRAHRVDSLLSAKSGYSNGAAGDETSASIHSPSASGASIRERSWRMSRSEDGHHRSGADPDYVAIAANGSRLDAQDVMYADKSSAEIEAELRVIEGEGRKMLDAFEGLEGRLFKKAAITTADDEVLHSLERSLPAKRDLTPMTANGSKRPPFSAVRSNGSNRSGSESIHRAIVSPLAATPATAAALKSIQDQLVDVRTRRADVVHRYEERIAFLKSKARGARIREQLA